MGLTALKSSKKEDLGKALNWFKLSAIQAFPPAQYSLGVLYDKGLGVLKNKSKALLWYYAAAENNHAKAQYNLGVFFLKGTGTSRNLKEANIWFSKAAEQGVKEATDNLLILSRVKDNSAEVLNQFEFRDELGFSGTELPPLHQ